MRRGTTPTHIFNVDIDLTDAAVIYITYRQKGKNLLEITGDDLTVDPEKITAKLTQEQTLAFEPGTVDIQIRARFEDGSAIASNVIQTTANTILKEGVI